MPVTRSDLTEVTGPRGRRCEYTRKCGWIDWSHAKPDRDDLKAIWEALDSFIYVVHVKADDGRRLEYIKVQFKLEMNWKQRWGSGLPKEKYTYFVPWNPSQQAPGYFKRAAMTLYLYACTTVEVHQGSRLLEWKANSSFAMEDMVSNLMAFYQLVEGLSADQIIEKAGGWVNREESLKMSQLVFDAMEKKDVDQPKAYLEGWYHPGYLKGRTHQYAGYLFNDVAGIDDRRGGWTNLPEFFQSIEPLPWSKNYRPGALDVNVSDIGYEWTEEEARTSLNRAPSRWDDGTHLAHLRGYYDKTGHAGLGRRPGPLGMA